MEISDELAKTILEQREQSTQNTNEPIKEKSSIDDIDAAVNNKLKEINSVQMESNEYKSLGNVNELHDNINKDTSQPKEYKSLGTAEMMKSREAERTANIDRAKISSIGWKSIPIQNLPTKGVFYPEGTKILIRAAQNEEIRHYSTIDENDLIDVDDKLNMIVDKCIQIQFPGTIALWKDLYEVDRFYLVYSVSELTFPNGNNRLQMNITCTECGNVDKINLNRNHFNFFDIPNELMQFYNKDELSFSAKVLETGEEIHIYLPTLGVTNYIKHYIRKKVQKGQPYDRAFIKIAPFLFSNYRRLTDATFNSKNEETLGWSHEKYSYVIDIISELQNAIKPEIAHSCSNCTAEVVSTISFQGGLKALFLYRANSEGSIFSKLGKL